MIENSLKGRANADRAVDVELLGRAERVAEQLLDVVNQEREYMRKRDVTAVNALTMNKQRLLEALAVLEPSLAELHSRQSEAGVAVVDAFSRVVNLMEQARRANSENMGIAMTELTHAHDALALLRSMLSLDDLTLYGIGGALNVNREQRRLGSA